MIKLTVGKVCIIEGLDKKVREHLKKQLTIYNPSYEKISRITGSDYAAQEYYKYWKETLNWLMVPRGMRQKLLNFFEKMNLEVEVIDKTTFMKAGVVNKSTFVPRDYQIPAVNDAKSVREGIIQMSMGAGKTLVALDLIHQLGEKATILVNTTVLLDQFVDECKKYWGYTPGIIGDGKQEIKDITVCTVQSLHNNAELLEALAKNTSTLIVDENQSYVSPERIKVLQVFNPWRIYGLSATPHRSKDDGRTEAVPFFFGDICHIYESEQAKPTVEVTRTGIDIEVGEYQSMILEMIQSEDRNNLISGLVFLQMLAGRRTLVLTKRIDHYRNIEKVCDRFEEARAGLFFIDSKDAHRNETLRKLKNGEQDFVAIFGTTSLLAVGTDIPSLDTLIIACDMKSDVLTTQSAGRILRLFEGKKDPKIIDLWDDKNPILTRQFWERRSIYEKKSWTIKM